MLIQVLHYDRSNNWYEHVADVCAPESGNEHLQESLEFAYRYTQNLDGSWSLGKNVSLDRYSFVRNADYNDRVTNLKPPVAYNGREYGHRSTSVGDRLIVEGTTYEVSDFGFKELDIFG